MAENFPPAGLTLPEPDWGFKREPESDIRSYSMGDGYEVRVPAGLNYSRENFSPTWSSLDPAVGLAAYNFLKPKLMLISVMWKEPVTGQIFKVIPNSLSLTYDTWGNAVLDVTFKQDFNPG